MKDILARNLKMLREKLKLSQQELADYLNIPSRESISQYENGKRELPLDVLERCCNLFGVELIDMFEEDESKVTTSIHFAFRADELDVEDLRSISHFKKIINNYRRMKNIINDRSSSAN